MTRDDENRAEGWLNARRRVGFVVVGSGWIYVVALLLSLAANASLLGTLLVVAMCAVLEMLILCELSRRLFLSNSGEKRFGLATLFLVVTGLSIYLSAIGCLVRRLQAEEPDIPSFVTTLLLIVPAFLFVAISTIILTHFAEALVWAGRWMVKGGGIRGKKRAGVRHSSPRGDEPSQ